MIEMNVDLMTTILVLLIAHFFGDFFLQSRWMAEGKSKKFFPLVVHTAIYSFVLAAFTLTMAPELWMAFVFVAFNGMLHMATDFVTSRAARYAYSAQDNYSFFLILGLDQLFHYFCLFLTIPLIT